MKKSEKSSRIEFLQKMDGLINESENQLEVSGYPRHVWKKIKDDISFEIYPHKVMFGFLDSIGSYFEDATAEENTALLKAECWAQIASLAELAKNCHEGRKLFSIGFSLMELQATLEVAKLLNEKLREKMSIAGKKKLGKFGAVRLLIREILAVYPTIKPIEIFHLLRADDERLEDIIEKIGPSFKTFSIVKSDVNRKIIEYMIHGKCKAVAMRSISNIISDLKK